MIVIELLVVLVIVQTTSAPSTKGKVTEVLVACATIVPVPFKFLQTIEVV